MDDDNISLEEQFLIASVRSNIKNLSEAEAKQFLAEMLDALVVLFAEVRRLGDDKKKV